MEEIKNMLITMMAIQTLGFCAGAAMLMGIQDSLNKLKKFVQKNSGKPEADEAAYEDSDDIDEISQCREEETLPDIIKECDSEKSILKGINKAYELLEKYGACELDKASFTNWARYAFPYARFSIMSDSVYVYNRNAMDALLWLIKYDSGSDHDKETTVDHTLKDIEDKNGFIESARRLFVAQNSYIRDGFYARLYVVLINYAYDKGYITDKPVELSLVHKAEKTHTKTKTIRQELVADPDRDLGVI